MGLGEIVLAVAGVPIALLVGALMMAHIQWRLDRNQDDGR